MKDKKELKDQYKELFNTYVMVFCKKHDLDCHDVDYIGPMGDIIYVSDMFISFNDIRYDIDNNIDKDKFIFWYWKDLELSELGMETINYPSYCKGLNFKYNDEDIERIKECHKKIEEAQKNLEMEIDKLNNK